jgi:formylglycine-generating enzyme required for sulfatase activity
VIAGMAPADRIHARRVLLRLVTSEGTRVRRTEAELSVSASTKDALAALVKGRLLVVHDDENGATFELAHEVLVRGWGTLRAWLDDDAEDRARRERLAQACSEWQRVGKRPEATLRGGRLTEALALDRSNLTELERELVTASVRAMRRRKWLLRIAIVGVMLLAIAVYAIQRTLAAHRLADEVDAEVATAVADLEGARVADRRQRTLAAEAYGKFDAGDKGAGEAKWKDTLAARDNAERLYRSASRGVEAALAKDPTRADVRALLGDILLARAELAETVHDTSTRDELLGRVAAYDADGTRRAKWSRPGRVKIHASPGAEIRLDGKPVGIGDAEVTLAAGAYAIDATAPGKLAVHEPIVVGRDDSLEIDVSAPAAIPDGFVYVPAGAFLYGSAADEDTRGFLTTVPIHRRATGAFAIARTEVTVGDWLAFVDAQPEAQRKPLIPAINAKSGSFQLTRTPAGWHLMLQPIDRVYTADWQQPLRYTGRKLRAEQNWLKLPVLGVSATDAEAYVAWLARSGRVPGARLCNELEWERAARGADGRDTPTGRGLDPDDANIDITYDRDLMGPDEVGAHPASASPYGLHDMAGNAFEWTIGDRGIGHVMRGGSYYHDRKTAALSNRNETADSLRDATGGLRVCATPR